MSSAPAGLDPREYRYGYFAYAMADDDLHLLTTRNAWLITRIQLFASADNSVQFDAGAGNLVTVAPGGCFSLEPNGAYRGDLTVEDDGEDGGAMLIVEYWYQATETALVPTVIP